MLEHGLGWLEGLLQDLACLVIEPAVVGASNTAVFEEPVIEGGASVQALLLDEPIPLAVVKEQEIFPEHA
jgi:hypothetical protein